MTIRKLYKKYLKLQQQKYETIFIDQVLRDLRLMISELDLAKYKRKGLIK